LCDLSLLFEEVGADFSTIIELNPCTVWLAFAGVFASEAIATALKIFLVFYVSIP
jgi:hypothetical protein